MTSTNLLLLSALMLLGPAGVATAQQPARDAYIGMGLGSLAYEIRTGGKVLFDTSSSLTKFYGGFRLTRNWGFEASYQLTDSASVAELPTNVAEDLFIPGLVGALMPSTTVRLEIATIRAIRFFNFDWGSLIAGLGASGAAIDTDFSLTGFETFSANIHASKNGLTVNTGAQWQFSSLVLRLEYEWWDADMRSLGLSLQWRL